MTNLDVTPMYKCEIKFLSFKYINKKPRDLQMFMQTLK